MFQKGRSGVLNNDSEMRESGWKRLKKVMGGKKANNIYTSLVKDVLKNEPPVSK